LRVNEEGAAHGGDDLELEDNWDDVDNYYRALASKQMSMLFQVTKDLYASTLVLQDKIVLNGILSVLHRPATVSELVAVTPLKLLHLFTRPLHEAGLATTSQAMWAEITAVAIDDACGFCGTEEEEEGALDGVSS
jgi:hypothetical protein